MTDRLEGIHTNIITGFLGAGKSTAILNLLENKPQAERWAILVNEFGEVGIDGGLLSAGNDGSVFIREVPGGCMCCTAGLPMQMAMNMLLARAKPDRLIIEPTGLGHPHEVVSILSSKHYEDVLDLRAIVTLVDARKISDDRYTSHKTFNEQLEIADVIVASKSDLYGEEDFANLEAYLSRKDWPTERMLLMSGSGDLTSELLEMKAGSWRFNELPDISPDPGTGVTLDSVPTEFPPEGFVRLSNRGEGFVSHGWIFRPSFSFSRDLVADLIYQSSAERVKALVRTNDGYVGFNFAGDSLTEVPLQPLEDSRLEVIAGEDFDASIFEQCLLDASRSVSADENPA